MIRVVDDYVIAAETHGYSVKIDEHRTKLSGRYKTPVPSFIMLAYFRDIQSALNYIADDISRKKLMDTEREMTIKEAAEIVKEAYKSVSDAFKKNFPQNVEM